MNTKIIPLPSCSSEFEQVHRIISRHRTRASQTVNHENLLAAWDVGAYVSERLAQETWGSKTVMQLSEFLRGQDASLRGYSRRNIYNMVLFYDFYSSAVFEESRDKIAQNQWGKGMPFLPDTLALEAVERESIAAPAIVQLATAQFMNLTTLTNHFEILNRCKSVEERIFYVMYAHKERLSVAQLKRCLSTHSFESLMGDRHNFSKGLKSTYPEALPLFKDTLFVDFLDLPLKHSERRLQEGILSHMKDFVLELGSDFLFYGQEYPLHVGSSSYKVDLLFYHRGLQCLVAIELKAGKFKPEFMGQLEFYLEALDRDVRRSNENPSIGILLCQEADRSVVEYAMSRSLSPTMIAEYKRQLIPVEVLRSSLEAFSAFLARGRGQARR